MSKPQQPTDDDASNPKFNVSCFEFLLIELVPLAYRITAELTARDNALLASASQAYPFSKFSANKPRPNTPLDSIKFICKDLWTLLFRKQIDNLKTNHRGVFVLTDNRFQPLHRVSPDRRRGPKGVDEALSRAQAFLWFPCGVIRGALEGLGLDVTVQAETTELPCATFQIRTVGAKP
ncbi:hypothetical protein H2203_002528 [Taxawa tesnikishii (nom. ined.)]|nr:hypothetical protein H2203_002528 [Dothideales sp. JES 119]